ncbi:MAG TPA: hypothetical protein VHW00_25095 [Thermoanaerobaculia bacterium]|nr:hypothetical protein [Thermoanaerobaculia bacterium]
MTNLVYSADGSTGATLYTFSAGEPLCIKDALKYAYIGENEQIVAIWIESVDGSASPGANVLTGDSIYVKCRTDTDQYLDVRVAGTYAKWHDEGLGDSTWTIHFHGDNTSGAVIPLGQPFVLWNGNGQALSPIDTSFCTLGDGSDVWSITASS